MAFDTDSRKGCLFWDIRDLLLAAVYVRVFATPESRVFVVYSLAPSLD